MHYLISGGTGFIGRALVHHLASISDHQLTVLTRNSQQNISLFPASVSLMEWNQLETIQNVDVIINLAGENLFSGFLTSSKKKQIVSSRLEATRKLVQFAKKQQNTLHFLSASGIHIYPADGREYDDKLVNFDEPKGFMGHLAQEWEAEALKAASENCRVVTMRFGAVLHPSGGLLAKTLPLTRYYLGAILSTGEQPFPWIALDDLVSAVVFVLNHSQIEGAINFVAPEHVSQKQFSETLAHVLGTKCFLKIPGFIIRSIFGTIGEELFLNGPVVKPTRLLEAGFIFHYPTLHKALE